MTKQLEKNLEESRYKVGYDRSAVDKWAIRPDDLMTWNMIIAEGKRDVSYIKGRIAGAKHLRLQSLLKK